MTGVPGKALTVSAPATCPRCAGHDICLLFTSGESFVDLHCGADHQTPGICGWRVTHFVGIGEPFVVVTPDEPA